MQTDTEIAGRGVSQVALGERRIFYVGGEMLGEPGARCLCGQMFVEAYVPKCVRRTYPIIFFHGAGQTNVNWLSTPDGRMGWADYFVSRGYVTYLVEQPARGRSAHHAAIDGKRIYHSLETIEKRFTSDQGDWPQAKCHTQWPGTGRMDDPDFLAFAQSQVEYLPSNKRSQELVLAGAGELLSHTGPAILLTHSQAGPFGWTILDAHPDMVAGVVALEPSGPPFAVDPVRVEATNYGITDLPLAFSPPLGSPAEMRLQPLPAPERDLCDGWVASEPARILPNFRHAPILLLVAEASYHAGYDHLTSAFLTRAGVEHDFIRLENVGIHGNGHMMMLEKNNLEIAAFIDEWLCDKVAGLLTGNREGR